ncbi:unnamed protein product [Rotaria sordida]|uniref:F-box domain-containing protein n=1 Tax=Rotaria sordida TaxID=392033 RepID=A0A819IZL4_9BILA|nr:unnamed protein product [Rotaria sordida]
MLLRQCFGINDSNNDHEDENTLNCNVYHLARRLRRTKPNISIFEFLPNELILNLFEYLYCDDIIYAFNNLNYRFQLLLYTYEYYHLNFDQIIMKSKFNLIENLPLNIQHVKSLTLSNNVYSSTNIEQCLLKYPIELFYIRLQSLSFIPRDTDQLLYLILLLPNFQQLKYLLISQKLCTNPSDNIIKQIRDIILFEIKTLKYFTWDNESSFFTRMNEAMPIEKSTIEYYEFRRMNIDEFEWLNFHTINMKSIHIYAAFFYSYSYQQQQAFETLTCMKIDEFREPMNFQNLFKFLSFLTLLKQLEIKGLYCEENMYTDGHRWENFIQEYLPQLKIFKFFFTRWDRHINIEVVIASFMTNFWLIEKKWFVTCDHKVNEGILYIYTVPYMKNKLKYLTSCQRISTAKINDTSNIRQLILHEIKTKDIILKDHFTNLQSLEIWKISDDITYDQLNRFLNISSIKNIVFRSRINSNLFYDILKYNTTQISIEIGYNNLIEMLRRATSHNRRQIIVELKKIKQLGIDFWCVKELTEKQIRKICYLFSNIEQLIIKRAFKSNELISLLIRKLKHLSFLSINYSKFAASTETNNSDIRQWLIDQSRTKLNENNFICKWSEEQFDLWID